MSKERERGTTEVAQAAKEGTNVLRTRLEIPREVYARIRMDINNAATGMRYLAAVAPEVMKGRTDAIRRLLERCSADLSLIEIVPVRPVEILRNQGVEKHEGA